MTQEQATGDDVPARSSGQGSDQAGLPERAVEVRLRRAPKYRAFIVTGTLAGAIAGVIVALAVNAPDQGDETFAASTLVRYFGAVLGLLGAVVGAAFAVLSERRRR